MNRGSAACEQTRIAVAHGFNEAPIHESGKYPEVLMLLSCESELQ